MEAHPPKLIETLVTRLIPAPCREHVLGDLHERYNSPSRYILDALSVLPYVVFSQVRRTASGLLITGQAAALYVAFAGASLVAGPGYLYDNGALVPLAITIAVMLAALVLCDAYADPRRPSAAASWRHVILALAC